MKKTLSLVLLSALILALMLTAACGKTPPADSNTPVSAPAKTEAPPADQDSTDITTEPIPLLPPSLPEYPDDMVPATKTASVKEAGNVELTVTVHGYESESLGKEFFLLYDRPLLVEVTLEVTLDPYGADIIERTLPTSCRELAYPKENAFYRHNHEVNISVLDKAGLPLIRIMPPDICCPTAIEKWRPKSNTSETYYYLFTAGTLKESFPYDEMTADSLSETVLSESSVAFYSPEFYKWNGDDGYLANTFEGKFSFPFTRTGVDSCEIETHNASVTMDLPVLRPMPIE